MLKKHTEMPFPKMQNFGEFRDFSESTESGGWNSEGHIALRSARNWHMAMPNAVSQNADFLEMQNFREIRDFSKSTEWSGGILRGILL